MSTIAGLYLRINKTLAAIEQRRHPKPVMPLPFVFLTTTGEDWPGYEESNRTAYRHASLIGVGVSAYAGIDPDEDGIES
jgi:hypothetical protein